MNGMAKGLEAKGNAGYRWLDYDLKGLPGVALRVFTFALSFTMVRLVIFGVINDLGCICLHLCGTLLYPPIRPPSLSPSLGAMSIMFITIWRNYR